MKKQIKNPFQNTKIKGFLFFLMLATFFWILTKFSRQYTTTATTTIEYVNIPAERTLSPNNLKSIDFNLTTNGFEFLYYKINKPAIIIDVASFYSETSKEAVVPNTELVRLISTKLKSNISIKDLSINDLNVILDEIVSKKVAVHTKIEVSYKNGFRPIDTIRIKPDSVVVSGPSEFVSTINFIETESYSENNIDGNISKKIQLQNPDSQNLILSTSEVMLTIAVAEFSQKEVILNVEVINVPENTIIKLIPEVVTVTFDASVGDFTDIAKQEFRLICDYADRNKEENFMIPKLVQFPKGIVNIEIDSEKIDYLIFK